MLSHVLDYARVEKERTRYIHTLEETGGKREKRRREYPTTDDIIGELLCLFRVILAAEILLSLSLPLLLPLFLFIYLIASLIFFRVALIR